MIRLPWYGLVGIIAAATYLGWLVGFMTDINSKRRMFKEIAEEAQENYLRSIQEIEEKRRNEV